jgi:hypothetical protein
MNKDVEAWACVVPDAFLTGSIVQARNVIEMACQDIARLAAENKRLRDERKGLPDMPFIDYLIAGMTADDDFTAVERAENVVRVLHQAGYVIDRANKNEQLFELLIAMIENDPEDMAADGVTVLDVWRAQARRLVGSRASWK